MLRAQRFRGCGGLAVAFRDSGFRDEGAKFRVLASIGALGIIGLADF